MAALVLVTGGTGKTGKRLVAQLQAGGHPCRVASRHPYSRGASVAFDWTEKSTWHRALEGVTAVYLVAPPIAGDPAPMMIDFIHVALAHGAHRFVLLSGSPIPPGGPAMGQVHQWLTENAPEWAALRPSWFMENFSEGPHRATIVDEDRIYSAAGNGKLPFIAGADIAACALATLVAQRPANGEFILTGNDLLTYDDVATRIGAAVGRTIVHQRITVDELAERHRAREMGAEGAQMLAMKDLAIEAGIEDRTTNCCRTADRPCAGVLRRVRARKCRLLASRAAMSSALSAPPREGLVLSEAV